MGKGEFTEEDLNEAKKIAEGRKNARTGFQITGFLLQKKV